MKKLTQAYAEQWAERFGSETTYARCPSCKECFEDDEPRIGSICCPNSCFGIALERGLNHSDVVYSGPVVDYLKAA